jgi:hypothetical protein
MNRGSLARLLGFQPIDLHSVDSLTRGIRTQDGVKVEALYLKEMGDPTPSEDRYGNIPCTLLHSTEVSERIALIYLQAAETAPLLDAASWLKAVIRRGIIVLGMRISQDDALGRMVTRVSKGVSYLTLRRDLVDYRQIVLWGSGEPGVWGLLAAILDERASGVVLETPPRELSVGGSEVLRTADVCALLPPRWLAVIGLPDSETAFEGTRLAYARGGNTEAVRFETNTRHGVRNEVLRWMLQRRSD